MKTIRQLKSELFFAIVSVFMAFIALSSATYAWYVANSTVTVETSTISAMTNGFVLQIADAKDGRPEGDGSTLQHVFTEGGILSPASSDDMKNWYVFSTWNSNGKVAGYRTPVFDNATDVTARPGQYTIGGVKYFAYIRSDYLLYTISETGLADVYLEDGGPDNPPITISTSGGTAVSTFTDSLRVAITTESVDENGAAAGDEELRIVYALKNETGIGNDASGKAGWTSIQKNNESSILENVTYQYIYNGNYIDQRASGAKNWVATKVGDNYTVPSNSEAIASRVDYNGVIIHIYIWMEGTDSDCVNGKSIEDDTNTYDVTVKFAGVAVG